uniref:Protein archease-like n=1 Tax=Haemonchus contortus TaxID=6289 RepID=W6NE40_HAECO
MEVNGARTEPNSQSSSPIFHPLKKRARKSHDDDEDMGIEEAPTINMMEGTSDGVSGYRYLEHPADVQVHSWGPDLATALAQAVTATYGYMTDLEYVEEQFSMFYTAKANDLQGLVIAVMEEALCGFQSEPFFIGRRVIIEKLDLESWSAEFQVFGECFDLAKHTQLTDVKAITYSNLQIHQKDDQCDIYVILDI